MKETSRISDDWGSFVAIPKAFTLASKSLTDKARWLFVLLREYTNGDSGVAFPSYDTIRERTGWGRSQISNAIKCLEKHGWITRQHQFGGVTLYRLVKPNETNSTESKLLETPQVIHPKNPKPRLQKSQTETPIVPNRDAIKIETTKTEITKNIVINPKADLSLVATVPVGAASTEDYQDYLCECGDRKSEHENGEGACKLNGLGHGLPSWEAANNCTGYKPTGIRESDNETVQVNGVTDAPPPSPPRS